MQRMMDTDASTVDLKSTTSKLLKNLEPENFRQETSVRMPAPENYIYIKRFVTLLFH